jgi:hypothetical protein
LITVVNQKGQSLVEVVFLLPIIFGLFVVTSKINTAIQVAIVNQQYARAQALTLAQNSPYYPRREQQKVMATKNSNQLIMGVADQVLDEDDEGVPKATVQVISRTRGLAGSEPQDKEPEKTYHVRLRNTVSLCTHPIVVRTQNGYKLYGADQVKENFTPNMLDYCRNGNFANNQTGGSIP